MSEKHTVLYPCGKWSVACKVFGHEWKSLFVHDRQFRHCLQCERMERKIAQENGKDFWEINEIKFSTV